MTLDGKKHTKILIDPLDKPKVEGKMDAIAEIYRKLTTHPIEVCFMRPNSYQQKVIDSQKSK